MRMPLLVTLMMAIVPVAAFAAQSNSMNPAITPYCKSDIAALCSSVAKGHEYYGCLVSHRAKLSAGCFEKVKTVSCKQSIKKGVKSPFKCK